MNGENLNVAGMPSIPEIYASQMNARHWELSNDTSLLLYMWQQICQHGSLV